MKHEVERALLVIVFLAAQSAGCLIEATAANKTPVEIIYISNKYLFPTAITRPKGQFLVVIKNQSNLKHLILHIKKRGSADDIVLADIDAEENKYEALIDLEPGVYTIFEPGHPKLACTLTIIP